MAIAPDRSRPSSSQPSDKHHDGHPINKQLMGRIPNNGPSLSGWRIVRLQSKPPSFKRMPASSDPFWEFETLKKLPMVRGVTDISKDQFPSWKRDENKKSLPKQDSNRAANPSNKRSAPSRKATRDKARDETSDIRFEKWRKKLGISVRKEPARKTRRGENIMAMLREKIRHLNIAIADAEKRGRALGSSRFFGHGMRKYKALVLKLKSAQRMKTHLQVLIRKTRLDNKLEALVQKKILKRKS